MNEEDIKYMLKTMATLSAIPARIYKNDEQIFYYSIVDLIKDPIILHLEEIKKIKENVGYFLTQNFYYYGIVRSGEYLIVVGPSLQTNLNDSELRDIAFSLDLVSEEANEFISSMKTINHMPLESTLQMLNMLNFILNNEKKELKDVYIQTDKQYKISKEIDDKGYDSNTHSMNAEVHNTFSVEELLMNYISHGDVDSIKDWVSNAPAIRGGLIAEEELRQRKNIFIVSVTLASRAAIRGGLDVDDSLSLSDSYIKQCELLKTLEDITNLQYNMIVTFASKVQSIRLKNFNSKMSLEIANYVHHNISKNITTEDIANHLYLNRSRLCVKFKEETGISLHSFILKVKIDEAKRLLRYTDKSLSSISSYLGFSSQSHFSKVFKDDQGITPYEYIEKHRRLK